MKQFFKFVFASMFGFIIGGVILLFVFIAMIGAIVGSSGSEKEVEISVQDDGRGIDMKDQERIFLQFERAGSNVNEAGLGLGLYISQQIVLSHGGSIRIESSIGKGAKFILRLPI